MKRFDTYFLYSLTLVISLFLFGGMPSIPHRTPTHKHSAPTAEQRTSHMVTFFDEKGKKLGDCTSTAIGPNAFLTAEHCNDEGEGKLVSFDLSTEKHILIAHADDNRDHVIYLFFGSSFTHIETVKTKAAVVGETVTIYGNIRGEYPAIPRYGKVIECDDYSELDVAAGEACYSLKVDHGDSGSAVFNTKGEIVGLVTYASEEDNGSTSAIGFSLNFDAQHINAARAFVPRLPE
jgi:hypothetical protein